MTTPPPHARHAALVFNPIKVDKHQLRDSLERLAAEAGWSRPTFHPTSVDDPGQGATREALQGGASVVLVAGGDGTVRAVSEAVAGTAVPLAIVPSGTGNLLARNIGLPLGDHEIMMQAAFEGNTHPFDIGWAELVRADGTKEEHAFVVLAGMGLDAHMIANTRPDLKKAVGWVAYVDGAARSLPRSKPFRIVYQLDDSRLHTTRVQSVLFANCGTLPAGISLIPDASITDGMLDLAVIQPSGPFGWIAVWRKVWWDNSVLRRFRAGRAVLRRRGRDSSIRYWRGRTAEAACAVPTPFELDGDEFGEATRVRCRVAEGALTLVVPDGHDVDKL